MQVTFSNGGQPVGPFVQWQHTPEELEEDEEELLEEDDKHCPAIILLSLCLKHLAWVSLIQVFENPLGQIKFNPLQHFGSPETQNSQPLDDSMHVAGVNIAGGGLKQTGEPKGQPAITPGAQFSLHPSLQTAVFPSQLIEQTAFACRFEICKFGITNKFL